MISKCAFCWARIIVPPWDVFGKYFCSPGCEEAADDTGAEGEG